MVDPETYRVSYYRLLLSGWTGPFAPHYPDSIQSSPRPQSNSTYPNRRRSRGESISTSTLILSSSISLLQTVSSMQLIPSSSLHHRLFLFSKFSQQSTQHSSRLYINPALRENSSHGINQVVPGPSLPHPISHGPESPSRYSHTYLVPAVIES